mgnify:CR=1 FL=1
MTDNVEWCKIIVIRMLNPQNISTETLISTLIQMHDFHLINSVDRNPSRDDIKDIMVTS